LAGGTFWVQAGFSRGSLLTEKFLSGGVKATNRDLGDFYHTPCSCQDNKKKESGGHLQKGVGKQGHPVTVLGNPTCVRQKGVLKENTVCKECFLHQKPGTWAWSVHLVWLDKSNNLKEGGETWVKVGGGGGERGENLVRPQEMRKRKWGWSP